MKNLIFTLLSLLVGGVGFAQIATRSIYETPGQSDRPSFVSVERNSSPYFMGLTKTDATNVILAHGYIDPSTLDVNEYQYITLPLSKDSFTLVNLVNIVGAEAEICLLKRDFNISSRTNIVYIKVNLQSNSVVSRVDVEGQFATSYMSGTVYDGKAIVYGYDYLSNSWKRIAKSLNTAPEVEGIGLTLSTYGGANKISEVVHYEGSEYVAMRITSSVVNVLRRNGSGTYNILDVSIAGGQLWDFDAVEGVGLIVTDREKFIRISSNLTVQSSHSYPNPLNVTGNNNYIEMVRVGNNYKIYSLTPKGGMIFTYNGAFELVNSFQINHRFYVYGTVSASNRTYVYGQLEVPYPSNSILSGTYTSFGIMDCNQNVDFIEHDRTFRSSNMIGNISNHATTFRNWTNDFALYYMVDDVPKSMLFHDSELLVGKGVDGSIVGQYSRAQNMGEAIVGPMFSGVFDENLRRDRHNRSYYVTKQMVEEHITAIQNGDANYVMPFDIRFWPGNGNSSFGEASQLAPFNDVNGNGIYEPSLGDFPQIYGDNCVLSIYHNPSREYNLSDLEVHRYVFSSECDTSEILKNAIFVKTDYINRGDRITEAYLGKFVDFDIGFHVDDHIGTHVGLSMAYGYNGDLLDESAGTIAGYGDNIPAVGKIFLSGMKVEANDIDDPAYPAASPSAYNYNSLNFGDGIVDNEYYTLTHTIGYNNFLGYPQADPVLPSDWHYAMQGLALDGSFPLYGQTGRFSFLGNSDPDFTATGGVIHTNNYTEMGNNAPGDRRILMSSGPGVMESGDTLTLLSAYLISFGELNDPQGPSVSQLFQDAAKLKAYFANNDLGCGLTFNRVSPTLGIKNVEKNDFQLYPNPFNNQFVVQHDFMGAVSLRVTNMNQQVILERDNVSNYEVLDLSVSAGIYFVELTSAKGVIVKKIVSR